MEKIITLDKVSKLDRYVYFDAYLLVNKSFSAFHNLTLSDESTIRMVKRIHKLNKKAYVLLDRVLFNDELVELKELVNKLEEVNCDGYFISDLGAINMLKEMGLNNKTFFYSQTQIVSKLEYKAYNTYKFKGIFVSKDYPLDNLIKCANENTGVGVNIYGYRNLFYSRRALLSAYKDEYNLKGKFTQSSSYLLREQKRTTKSIIYEDKHGTYVFTDYIDSHLNEIHELEDNHVEYILIDDNFVEEEQMERVLDFIKEPSSLYVHSSKEKDTYEK